MGYDYAKMVELIRDSGMSQKTFFNQIGMSEKTFTSWINGSSIPKEMSVRKIADRLGVRLTDLRTNSEVNAIPSSSPKDVHSAGQPCTPQKSIKTEPIQNISSGFSAEELEMYRGYSACIIFDTCSIMNSPDLLEFVNGDELVVVPKIVVHELEHNKIKFGFNDAGRKAQKAISAIHNYEKQYPLIFADDDVQLIPTPYRADNETIESNDNKILSVAIKHRMYTPLPVVFITDDLSLSNKATGEQITVCSATDFMEGVIPPFPSVVWDTEPRKSNPIDKMKQADENGEYNSALLYAIILKKVSSVRKYLSSQIDVAIKELGELYISLRTKKDVPVKKKLIFAELKVFAAEYIGNEDMNALALSFGAAYQDALSSLGGSIKQIAGDLE